MVSKILLAELYPRLMAHFQNISQGLNQPFDRSQTWKPNLLFDVAFDFIKSSIYSSHGAFLETEFNFVVIIFRLM